MAGWRWARLARALPPHALARRLSLALSLGLSSASPGSSLELSLALLLRASAASAEEEGEWEDGGMRMVTVCAHPVGAAAELCAWLRVEPAGQVLLAGALAPRSVATALVPLPRDSSLPLLLLHCLRATEPRTPASRPRSVILLPSRQLASSVAAVCSRGGWWCSRDSDEENAAVAQLLSDPLSRRLLLAFGIAFCAPQSQHPSGPSVGSGEEGGDMELLSALLRKGKVALLITTPQCLRDMRHALPASRLLASVPPITHIHSAQDEDKVLEEQTRGASRSARAYAELCEQLARIEWEEEVPASASAQAKRSTRSSRCELVVPVAEMRVWAALLAKPPDMASGLQTWLDSVDAAELLPDAVMDECLAGTLLHSSSPARSEALAPLSLPLQKGQGVGGHSYTARMVIPRLKVNRD